MQLYLVIDCLFADILPLQHVRHEIVCENDGIANLKPLIENLNQLS